MKILTSKQLVALTAALAMTSNVMAGSIGSVLAKSEIRIDEGTVMGNATLFDGNVVETKSGTGELRLRNGGAVVMDANSRLRVFDNNRAEFDSGKAQFRGVTAESGNIVVETAGSEAILERSANRLVIGSLRGAVRIKDTKGVLLASLNAGNAMAFESASEDQGGAQPKQTVDPSLGKGKLVKRGKLWYWVVAATGVAVPVTVIATRDGNKVVSRI